MKFATVTGTKVTSATKIITAALQNGLVSSATQAMDVLTALGDTAATTAEEIGKGMQKSAAAAKVAGVSYEELATMLTVITANTQLGGSQAGLALSTIFSRMHRVTAEKMLTDETGESVNINDVEAALGSAGVALRDSDTKQFRNTTEVLRDLATVWEDLNDIQKYGIMNAMAGTRQSNMFAALMEGLSENGGKDFDEKLGLAENSSGTTESKYQIAIQGVNGALEELKASWDSLVESVVSNGFIQTVLSLVTTMINGFKGVADAAGFIGVAL